MSEEFNKVFTCRCYIAKHAGLVYHRNCTVKQSEIKGTQTVFLF